MCSVALLVFQPCMITLIYAGPFYSNYSCHKYAFISSTKSTQQLSKESIIKSTMAEKNQQWISEITWCCHVIYTCVLRKTLIPIPLHGIVISSWLNFIEIHNSRRQRSLRHFIHYVYDLHRILLLDYSDQTWDASPNTPPQTESRKWLASSTRCIKTFMWRENPLGKILPHVRKATGLHNWLYSHLFLMLWVFRVWQGFCEHICCLLWITTVFNTQHFVGY